MGPLQSFIKTASGLASNAATDTGNLINGTLNIPSQVIQHINERLKAGDTTVLNPAHLIGEGAVNVGKGIVNEYNQALGEPLKGGDIAGRIVKRAYEKPVTTALDVLPVISALRGAKAASAAEVAPAEEGAIAAKAPAIPKEAVQSYLSNFELPRAVVNKMSMKPQVVVQQLIKDGVTNVGSLDDLKQTVANVTGDTGAFPKINRIILEDINKPVDYSMASQAINDSIAKYLKGSPEGLVNQVENQVRRAFPVYDSASQVADKVATGPQLFDTLQELGRLEDLYSRKSMNTYGDLINPEYERAADVINEVKNNVADAIDASITPEQYQLYKTDPRVLEQLQRVPPALAKRWVDTAKEFRDGRSVQAPYVNLGKMIDHTEDAQMSAFTNLRKDVAQPSKQASDLVSGIFHPRQSLENATRSLVGKVASVADKTPQEIMAESTSGNLPSLPQTKTPSAGLVTNIKNAATNPINPLIAAQGATLSNQNKEKELPSEKEIVPSKGQKYSLPSPFDSGMAMSTQEYADQKTALQKKIADDSATGNLYQKNVDQGQLDQLETKKTTQAPLVSKWQDTAVVTQLANIAYGLAQSAPPDPTQFSGWIDTIRKGTDPKYNKLTAALNYFHVHNGADFSQIKDKDSLLAALDQLVVNSQNEYNTFLQTFTGQDQSQGTLPPLPASPQVQSQPQPAPAPAPQSQPINFLSPDAGNLPPIPPMP